MFRSGFWNLVIGACLEFGFWNLELTFVGLLVAVGAANPRSGAGDILNRLEWLLTIPDVGNIFAPIQGLHKYSLIRKVLPHIASDRNPERGLDSVGHRFNTPYF